MLYITAPELPFLIATARMPRTLTKSAAASPIDAATSKVPPPEVNAIVEALNPVHKNNRRETQWPCNKH